MKTRSMESELSEHSNDEAKVPKEVGHEESSSGSTTTTTTSTTTTEPSSSSGSEVEYAKLLEEESKVAKKVAKLERAKERQGVVDRIRRLKDRLVVLEEGDSSPGVSVQIESGEEHVDTSLRRTFWNNTAQQSVTIAGHSNGKVTDGAINNKVKCSEVTGNFQMEPDNLKIEPALQFTPANVQNARAIVQNAPAMVQNQMQPANVQNAHAIVQNAPAMVQNQKQPVNLQNATVNLQSNPSPFNGARPKVITPVKGIFAHLISPVPDVSTLQSCDIHGATRSNSKSVTSLNNKGSLVRSVPNSLFNRPLPTATHCIESWEGLGTVPYDSNNFNSMLQNEVENQYQINAVHSLPYFPDQGAAGMGNNFAVPAAIGRGDDESSIRSDTLSKIALPKRGKKQSQLQSGVCAKATDVVKNPQDWPHIALQGNRVGISYSYHELDCKLFVTGELELISRADNTDAEHDGRILLLKHLMYLSKLYEWQTILMIYAEVVARIESELLTWSGPFEPTISWAITTVGAIRLGQKPVQQKSSGNKKSGYKSRPAFCKEYQSNSCPFSDEKHWGMLKGERVQVEHICAACLMKKGVVAQHGDQSTDCPTKSSYR